MSKTNRWNWLLLPVVFGIVFRIALWFYWMPDRDTWIRSHGGDPTAAAFGEGELDAWALIATASPWILSFVCCAVGAAPRLPGVVAIGSVAAVGAALVGALMGKWLEAHFSGFIIFHGPIIVVTIALITFHYVRMFRARDAPDAA
jgi:hypothetical protein